VQACTARAHAIGRDVVDEIDEDVLTGGLNPEDAGVDGARIAVEQNAIEGAVAVVVDEDVE
jgi:hypothetical protein